MYVLPDELRDLLKIEFGKLVSEEELIKVLKNEKYVVVNAENYTDLNRFSKAVLETIKRDKKFIFQGGASLVKSITETHDKPLIEGNQFDIKGNGVIVVGSYVKKSTEQLEFLKNHHDIAVVGGNIICIDTREAG